MAALDLHCGLEHGGRGWGRDRAELIDSFDSEMQEWEDQLQDMQRKIEELYKEVKARRGENESGHDSSVADGPPLDITLLPVSNRPGHHSNSPAGRHGNGGVGDRPVLPRDGGTSVDGVLDLRGNRCGCSSMYGHGGCSHPVNHLSDGYRFPNSCYSNGRQDPAAEVLHGRPGQGARRDLAKTRKNTAAPNTTLKDISRVRQDVSGSEGVKPSRGNERIGPGSLVGGLEEVENRKNQTGSHAGIHPPANHSEEPRIRATQRVSWREPITCQDPVTCREPNKENTGGFSKPPLRQREGLPAPLPLPLPVPIPPPRAAHPQPHTSSPDRKCVLADRKCSSPSVLRKFGAMLQENEGKTLTDAGVVTAATSPSTTPVCQLKFGAGGRGGGAPPSALGAPAAPHHAPHLKGAQRKAPAVSPRSPKSKRPSGAERDSGGPAGGPRADYRILNGPGAAQRHHRAGAGPCADLGRDSGGLMELLDMLEIEHQHRAAHTPQRQDTHQVSCDLSPASAQRSFSRPARPANQRPPSRWAGHAPCATISAPSGPVMMSRPPSPAPKAKQSVSFSLHTETAIM